MSAASGPFTSVSKVELQKAFAFSHKLSEDASVPEPQRIQFRAIAQMIWKSHGEPGAPPAGAGEALLGRMTFSEVLANAGSPK